MALGAESVCTGIDDISFFTVNLQFCHSISSNYAVGVVLCRIYFSLLFGKKFGEIIMQLPLSSAVLEVLDDLNGGGIISHPPGNNKIGIQFYTMQNLIKISDEYKIHLKTRVKKSKILQENLGEYLYNLEFMCKGMGMLGCSFKPRMESRSHKERMCMYAKDRFRRNICSAEDNDKIQKLFTD